ncbi:HAMP domain-containing histidine kinase [bacterium]|nr:HAMP domain-containing histidine kinase [bacterium]
MVYKNFRLQCTLRVILLGLTMYGFFYVLSQTHLYVTSVILGVIIIFEIITLVQYVEKTNRDLTRFLESVKHADFSQTFTPQGFGTSFDELKSAFKEIIDKFHQIRFEKEEHYSYLQTVVHHIGIGLIVFRSDGNVDMINASAKRLLKIGPPHDLTELKNIQMLVPLLPELFTTLTQLKPGQRSLIKIQLNNELVQLAVYVVDFRMRDQKFTLASLQNIQNELEEKEMEAWQKLIRVLTHEIMNSMTPVTSLASTANELLDSLESQNSTTAVRTDVVHDIRSALQTIQSRSKGLMHFVDAYRNLTRIPTPHFTIILISELFARIEKLMYQQVISKGIHFQVSIDPETLEVTADPELIEQILINLLLNAMQALENKTVARIELTAGMDENGRVVIKVTDNGPGISEEAIDKIFIPFFTTKQEGTGIGLSLSRQIMRLHKGTLSVTSKPKTETVFTLRF